MLCEKCKNLKESTLQGIKTKCYSMGFKGRIPAHQVDGGWLPGPTPKDLEDWCAKNCKPSKPAKPVEEKIITPATVKTKIVSSNKNSLNKNSASKDKKKD
jgi:hypothetical protein